MSHLSGERPGRESSRSDFNAGSASFKLGTKEVGLGFFICEMKTNLQLQFYDLLFC